MSKDYLTPQPGTHVTAVTDPRLPGMRIEIRKLTLVGSAYVAVLQRKTHRHRPFSPNVPLWLDASRPTWIKAGLDVSDLTFLAVVVLDRLVKKLSVEDLREDDDRLWDHV